MIKYMSNICFLFIWTELMCIYACLFITSWNEGSLKKKIKIQKPKIRFEWFIDLQYIHYFFNSKIILLDIFVKWFG